MLGAQLTVNALTGYAFQKTFAYYYGATLQKSMFDIAFAVPTMLIYLSGLGYTHAVVVSLFSRLRNTSSPASVSEVFSTLLNVSAIALITIVAVTFVFSDSVAGLLAPGLDANQQAEMQRLIVWMLPLAFIFGLSSYASAIALAWHLPVAQEILLLISRLAVIAYVLAHAEAVPLTAVAAVLIGSSLLALAAQWMVLIRVSGLQYRFVLRTRDPDVRAALLQCAGFLGVAVAAQVSYAYGRRVGTLAGPGVVALLGFAATLVDTISTIASKLVAYQIGQPIAASLQSSGSVSALSSLARKGIVLAVLGSLAACVLSLLAEPLVRFFYAGGAFQEAEVSETARYVAIMAVGLPAALVTAVLLYPLLGMGRHDAALIQVGAFLLHILFVRIAFESLQGAAVAWAYVVLLFAQAIGGWLLVKRHRRIRSAA